MTTSNTRQCSCGAMIEREDLTGFTLLDNTCEACLQARDATLQAKRDEEARQARAELERLFLGKFDGMTPDRLRTPNLDHPSFNGELWRKVADWKPTRERPWLGLVGETGACKSRCAFLRIRQFLIDDVKEWAGYRDAPKFDAAVITGMDFNRYAVEQYSRAAGETGWNGNSLSVGEVASKRLAGARSADLLLFDEIGKVRPAAGTIDELFALIDYRTSRNLVTIWTSNTPPERFCATWPDEYASPGCGRIIEASTILGV